MSQSVLQLMAIAPQSVSVTDSDEALGPLRWSQSGPHYALCRETPQDEFQGPGSEENFANLEWVTRRAVAHQGVIDAARLQTPLCPLPLGVLFRDEEKLDDFLSRNASAVAEFFAETSEREEYGVKLFAKEQAEQGAPVAKPSSGADRLRQKLAARHAAEDQATRLDTFVAQTRRDLEAITPRVRDRKVVSDLREDGYAPLAGFAVLADQNEAERLQEWGATQSQNDGFSLEITGPWPAYAFCPSLT